MRKLNKFLSVLLSVIMLMGMLSTITFAASDSIVTVNPGATTANGTGGATYFHVVDDAVSITENGYTVAADGKTITLNEGSEVAYKLNVAKDGYYMFLFEHKSFTVSEHTDGTRLMEVTIGTDTFNYIPYYIRDSWRVIRKSPNGTFSTSATNLNQAFYLTAGEHDFKLKAAKNSINFTGNQIMVRSLDIGVPSTGATFVATDYFSSSAAYVHLDRNYLGYSGPAATDITWNDNKLELVSFQNNASFEYKLDVAEAGYYDISTFTQTAVASTAGGTINVTVNKSTSTAASIVAADAADVKSLGKATGDKPVYLQQGENYIKLTMSGVCNLFNISLTPITSAVEVGDGITFAPGNIETSVKNTENAGYIALAAGDTASVTFNAEAGKYKIKSDVADLTMSVDGTEVTTTDGLYTAEFAEDATHTVLLTNNTTGTVNLSALTITAVKPINVGKGVTVLTPAESSVAEADGKYTVVTATGGTFKFDLQVTTKGSYDFFARFSSVASANYYATFTSNIYRYGETTALKTFSGTATDRGMKYSGGPTTIRDRFFLSVTDLEPGRYTLELSITGASNTNMTNVYFHEFQARYVTYTPSDDGTELEIPAMHNIDYEVQTDKVLQVRNPAHYYANTAVASIYKAYENTTIDWEWVRYAAKNYQILYDIELEESGYYDFGIYVKGANAAAAYANQIMQLYVNGVGYGTATVVDNSEQKLYFSGSSVLLKAGKNEVTIKLLGNDTKNDIYLQKVFVKKGNMPAVGVTGSTTLPIDATPSYADAPTYVATPTAISVDGSLSAEFRIAEKHTYKFDLWYAGSSKKNGTTTNNDAMFEVQIDNDDAQTVTLRYPAWAVASGKRTLVVKELDEGIHTIKITLKDNDGAIDYSTSSSETTNALNIYNFSVSNVDHEVAADGTEKVISAYDFADYDSYGGTHLDGRTEYCYSTPGDNTSTQITTAIYVGATKFLTYSLDVEEEGMYKLSTLAGVKGADTVANATLEYYTNGAADAVATSTVTVHSNANEFLNATAVAADKYVYLHKGLNTVKVYVATGSNNAVIWQLKVQKINPEIIVTNASGTEIGTTELAAGTYTVTANTNGIGNGENVVVAFAVYKTGTDGVSELSDIAVREYLDDGTNGFTGEVTVESEVGYTYTAKCIILDKATFAPLGVAKLYAGQ